jgi:hypothetical protein
VRAHTRSPDGIGDDVSHIPDAVAVLLVVFDDLGAGVVFPAGSLDLSGASGARFFFMGLQNVT